MIRLLPVTPDNWRVRLEVSEAQKGFVAPPEVILARAWAYRNERANAFMIYADDTPVGMALYYDDDEYGCYDLSQLFIDERFQGRGYGSEALRQLLEMMTADGRYPKVSLCYIDGNTESERLYGKFGFYRTYEEEEGDEELMMEKLLR